MLPTTKKVLALSFLTAVSAVPNVTVVPASSGASNPCSVYPSYDSTSSIAGPWIIQLANSDNPAIEGFGDNSQLFRTSGETGIHEGRVCLPIPIRLVHASRG